MKHQPLDIYDDMPPAMKRYISAYGFHFNKKAFEYAVKDMKRLSTLSNKMERIEPWSKEKVEEMLVKNGVTIENGEMYDVTYQANWAKADLYKSSIPDEQHLVLFLKDTIDDKDGNDELPFRYWMQKCIAMGKPIDWEEII